MKKICAIIIIIILLVLAVPIGFSSNTSESEVNKIVDCLPLSNLSIDAEKGSNISMLIRFDDSNFPTVDQSEPNGTTSKEIDMQLEAYRKEVKSIYLSTNQALVKKLSLDEFDYTVSYYSPFVELSFRGIEDYKASEPKLKKIINSNDKILGATVSSILDNSATINPNVGAEYSIESAFEDIGVNDSDYNGEGVKVGMIEFGTPDERIVKSGYYSIVNSYYQNEHSTVVYSIIGGNTGIARNALISMMGIKDEDGNLIYSLTEALNLMIDTEKVNIVNLSMGYDDVGAYDALGAEIDYISNKSKCTIIAAAGNGELHKIASPANGMNVITVGSCDKNQNVSSFSSYELIGDFDKPDMVAPGDNILLDLPNEYNPWQSGTSFAAPMVTGMLALLMEEFPILKENPWLAKSALQAGCDMLPSQTSRFDQQAGYGRVNYKKSREYLNKAQYTNFSIPNNAEVGDTVLSYDVTIPAMSSIQIHANWFVVNHKVSGGMYLIYTQCNIKIYDNSAKKYIASRSTKSNSGFIRLDNCKINSRTYRIELVVTKQRDVISDLFPDEYGSILYYFTPITNHQHSYIDSYMGKPIDMTFHEAYCICGDYIEERHVWAWENTGNRCRKCNIFVSGYVPIDFYKIKKKPISE